MTNTFELDAELDRISDLVLTLPVSQVRLMKDSRFLWVMLIPEVADITEWHQLSADQMATHGEEIRVVSKALELADSAEVINVGMFGHGVRQLHVHMAARHESDPLWPKIAFMTGPPENRNDEDAADTLGRVKASIVQAAKDLDSSLLDGVTLDGLG